MPPSARARRAANGQEGSGNWRDLADDQSSPSSLPSPASASATTGSSTSRLLPRYSWYSSGYLQRVLRRHPYLRALAGSSTVFVLFWLILLILGALDPSLHVGPHIDSRTFQVLPNGDPRRRQEPEYTRPPNYWQFIANWNEPSYDLLANAPPSQRACDKNGPLIFIGIFTHAGAVGRRQIIRRIFEPDLHPEGYRIHYKFILGRPPDDDWRYLLDHEHAFYKDIAILEDVTKDNIDEGKTVEYFKWLVKTLPDPKPQFVLKMDDDTFLVMPNVINNLSGLDCSKSIYWGTTQGANEGMFGKYMRGLCYGVSWPLASWIGSSNVTSEWSVGVEDARMGRIIQMLDPKSEPVQWIDHGWKMGDWNQLQIDENIVAFHWLKLDHWMPMVKRKILKAFADAGRPYRWDWAKYPLPQDAAASGRRNEQDKPRV